MLYDKPNPLIVCAIFLLANACASISNPRHSHEALGKLVYVADQALWLKQLPDGSPRQLVSGSGIQYPEFSLSGKWVSYKVADVPWAISLEEQNAKPIKINREDASQNGLFQDLRAPQTDFLLPDPDDVNSTINFNDKRIVEYLSNVDGKKIAYMSFKMQDASNENSDPPSFVKKLWYFDVDSRKAKLLRESNVDIGLLAWSMDSEMIFIMNSGQEERGIAFLSDGAGLEGVDINNWLSREFLPSVLIWEGYISPAANTPFLAVSAGEDRRAWMNKRLVLVNTSNGQIENLSAPQLASVSPQWSPDDKTIAYAASETDIVNEEDSYIQPELLARRIYTVDLQTKVSTQLSPDSQFQDEHPVWLEDGKHLLFARIDHNKNTSLWLADFETKYIQCIVQHIDTPYDYYTSYRWDSVLTYQENKN